MQMIVEIEVTKNFKRIAIVIGSFRATQSPKIRRTERNYHRAFGKVNILILKESETGPKRAINVRDYA